MVRKSRGEKVRGKVGGKVWKKRWGKSSETKFGGGGSRGEKLIKKVVENHGKKVGKKKR